MTESGLFLPTGGTARNCPIPNPNLYDLIGLADYPITTAFHHKGQMKRKISTCDVMKQPPKKKYSEAAPARSIKNSTGIVPPVRFELTQLALMVSKGLAQLKTIALTTRPKRL